MCVSVLHFGFCRVFWNRVNGENRSRMALFLKLDPPNSRYAPCTCGQRYRPYYIVILICPAAIGCAGSTRLSRAAQIMYLHCEYVTAFPTEKTSLSSVLSLALEVSCGTRSITASRLVVGGGGAAMPLSWIVVALVPLIPARGGQLA